MPTIGVNGSLGTSSSSMSDRAWGQQMKTNFDAGVGLSVSLPIFDGRQTKTAVNKATLQRRLAELDLQDNEKQLWSTIEGYWIDATTNQQKFRSAQVSVESQQASYDLLSGAVISEAVGVRTEKPRRGERSRDARAAKVFARLLASCERLLRIARSSEGMANKELAKFADQVDQLADKWEK